MKTYTTFSVSLIMLAAVAAGGCGKSSSGPGSAEKIEVGMNMIDENGTATGIGSVQISDSNKGLVITPNLSGLPPGSHGFHVHQNPDCGAAQKDGKMTAGVAAGEHYDPAGNGKHAGPDGKGHAGDLPRLEVGQDGKANGTLIAARLKVADLKGRSLMIHADTDDYAGSPGGARIACGVMR